VKICKGDYVMLNTHERLKSYALPRSPTSRQPLPDPQTPRSSQPSNGTRRHCRRQRRRSGNKHPGHCPRWHRERELPLHPRRLLGLGLAPLLRQARPALRGTASSPTSSPSTSLPSPASSSPASSRSASSRSSAPSRTTAAPPTPPLDLSSAGPRRSTRQRSGWGFSHRRWALCAAVGS
jgi:hypothetical protein